MASEPLDQAIALAKSGKKASARRDLLAILNVEPENVDAWMWLAFCAGNREEYGHALRQALHYDPGHTRARNLTIRLARRTIFEATGRDLVAERDEFKKGGRRRAAFTSFVIVLTTVILLAGLLAFGADVVIQAEPTAIPTVSAAAICEQNHAALQGAILARCSGLEVGQACLMNPSVTAQRSDSGLGDFSLAGDRTRLEDLQQISADPYNLAGGDWGLVALDTSALSVLLIGGLELAEFDPALAEFTLRTEPNLKTCDATAPSGMLIQGGQQQQLTVNGVRVDFVGTLFIEARADNYLSFSVLRGVGEVALGDDIARAATSEAVFVPLNPAGIPHGFIESAGAIRLDADQQEAIAVLASTLAFETDWVVADDLPVPLPESPGEVAGPIGTMIDMSPDAILFSSARNGDDDLFAVDAAGNLRQLTGGAGDDQHPALSPDGRLVVFRSDRSGAQDIYLLDLAEDSLHQLTLNAGNNTLPSWADDRILFTSDRDGTPQLWVMRMDGSSPQQITEADEGVVMGRMVARAGLLAYSLVDGGIVIESEAETITLDDPTAAFPAWSPDGSQLAYQSTRAGGAHIYIYDLATRSSRRLTDSVISGESQPTWHPSGEQIAFVSARTGSNDLFIYDEESGAVENVASGGVESPNWGALAAALSAPDVNPPGAWTRVPTAITSTLHDVEMFASDVGFAVGDNNTVLRLQSGVWGRMDLSEVRTAFAGDRLSFFAVDVISPVEAWAVGERGAIIHLQDERWRVVDSPTEARLFAIEGDWIVGDNGTMLRRIGDEWQMVEIPAQNALNGLYFRDEDTGWAFGGASTLLHWDGQTWERQLNAIRGDIQSMFGAYVVSDAGLFQLADNRWEGIAPLNVPSVSLTDVQVFEDGTGWAVGQDGVLLYGNGAAWGLRPHINYADLNAASFSDPSNGWAVGVDGALLHYNTAGLPEQSPPAASINPIDDPLDAIESAWRCDVLQGTAFYPYEIIIEAPDDDGTLVATGILPEFGHALLALDGTLLTEDFPEIDSEFETIAWLELRETEVLSGGDAYAADGLLRLWLREDGQMFGVIYQMDDESLVGEVRRCLAGD